MKVLYVYLVQKGSVKLGINASCGKILIKDIVYENSLFGENVFVEDNSRKEFAKTMTDTSVIRIPTDVFRSMVEDNGAFANDVMGVVLTSITIASGKNAVFCFQESQKKNCRLHSKNWPTPWNQRSVWKKY